MADEFGFFGDEGDEDALFEGVDLEAIEWEAGKKQAASPGAARDGGVGHVLRQEQQHTHAAAPSQTSSARRMSQSFRKHSSTGGKSLYSRGGGGTACSDRPLGAPTAQQQQHARSKWSCQICTLENLVSRATCAACGGPAPESVTTSIQSKGAAQ